jgi:hypothetical protein
VIVGFSAYGTGSAKAAVTYLTSPTNLDGSKRTPAPVVLQGNPEFVSKLIEALPFEKTYKSGVLSFAEGEDIVTPDMQREIMAEFERVAFAGMDPDEYSILWVKHTHTGRVELNFLIPRVHLPTGKSLNIDPPGAQSRALFDTFRSWINARYGGLADPDDPSRAQDVRLPQHLAKLYAEAKRQGKGKEIVKAEIREAITTAVRREVDAGRIHDQDGVVAFLKAQGYAVPRHGTDYITVVVEGERTRLKGGLYSEQFSPRANVREARYGAPDPERVTELGARLERMVATRAAYHQERYGRRQEEAEQRQEIVHPGHDIARQAVPDLGRYLRQHLGKETIEPRQRRPQTRARRRRVRVTQQEQTQGAARDDGPGTAATGRMAALSGRARQRYRTALGGVERGHRQLGDATQRIERGRGALYSGHGAFTASLDEALRWWERYLNLDDLEPER